MKKYITLAALLAAGTTLANAADTLTLDSTIINDATDDLASAWSATLGKTKNSSAVAGIQDFDRLSGNPTFPSQTFKLSSLYGASALPELGDIVVFDAFSILGPDNATDTNAYAKEATTKTITLSGTLNGVEVSYTSTALDDSAWYNVEDVYNPRTFSFSNAKIDADSEITISIDGGIGFACIKVAEGYSLGATAVENPNGGWTPVYQVKVSAVPEPSAFGMLAGLGALALVASRRRRK